MILFTVNQIKNISIANSPVDAYTYVDMQIRYTGVENLPVLPRY